MDDELEWLDKGINDDDNKEDNGDGNDVDGGENGNEMDMDRDMDTERDIVMIAAAVQKKAKLSLNKGST